MDAVRQSISSRAIIDITTLSIDVSKNTFHIVVSNRAVKPLYREKFTRLELAEFVANHPPCLIRMGACAGSQHLASKFEEYGHQVKPMPAQFVKPYLKSNKNNYKDASAIAEAVCRPTMRFVTTKTTEQHDQQALHRVSERLVPTRTSIIYQLRSFLLENGVAIRTGRLALANALPDILEDAEQPLADGMRALIHRLRNHWQLLDEHIKSVSDDLEHIAKSRDDCRRLLTAPGISPLVGTALLASVGTVQSGALAIRMVGARTARALYRR